MIFEKSQNVNYSILPKYDLIFTSPPYYKKEIYEHMEDFKNYESFFLKVYSSGLLDSLSSINLNFKNQVIIQRK